MLSRLRSSLQRAAIEKPATRPASPEPSSGEPVLDLIDVRDLIARHSLAEHSVKADAYFDGIGDDDMLLRKPFFGIVNTQPIMHGLAEVLRHLRLYPGARVLDFGAGTGWLSRILALLDCQPIATDVSAKALALGERAFNRDPLARNLRIDWRVFDGVTLPLEDSSVDRIVCYDAFHHVADQAAVLREFHRVLSDGGRVVFHEPGPRHSREPQSQYEMRHFDVIENDIVVEDIWAPAQALGFSHMELSLTAMQSASVPLDRYKRVVDGQAASEDVDDILRGIIDTAHNLRIFFIVKGTEPADSRHGTAGLSGLFEMIRFDAAADTLRGRVRVVNTGSTAWRASTGQVGSVSLGVRRIDGLGDVPDVGRIPLSDQPILPGQEAEVDFALPMPAPRPTRLLFDLVAEHVIWFELTGCRTLMLDLD